MLPVDGVAAIPWVSGGPVTPVRRRPPIMRYERFAGHVCRLLSPMRGPLPVSLHPGHGIERGDVALIDEARVRVARRDLGDAHVAKAGAGQRRLVIRHRPEVVADGDAPASMAERERDL